ncbi:MAG: DUF4115 domain-containing protein [Candidatus Omnitrophica bacterium]|nr:DUF4115 domain-containing protein [Candidatus Omnitrophota bacterium]
MDPKEIGNILKAARAKKNVSPEKIYKDTRIQKHVIRALENGNAEEFLEGTYVVLFLRKYASYLNLDAEILARDYKSFCKKDTEQKLEPQREAEARELKRRESLLRYACLLLSAIFIVLLLLLGVRLLYSGAKNFAANVRKEKNSNTREVKTQSVSIPKSEKISLKLYATDDVWMEIKEDGKKVFRGTLRIGKEKKLEADKSFSLWLGKAEAVDLTVNGKSIAPVARGVQKNILITRDGIKVGNKWIARSP